MLHLLSDWFGWPDGSVLTNLIASVIGFVIGYFATIHRKLTSLHEKQDRLHRHMGVPPKNDDA